MSSHSICFVEIRETLCRYLLLSGVMWTHHLGLENTGLNSRVVLIRVVFAAEVYCIY